VVVLWGGVSAAAAEALDCPVLSFDDVLGWGRDHQNAVPSSADLAAIRPDSLATLVYTSGTTGSPKVGLVIVACRSANLVMLQKHKMFGEHRLMAMWPPSRLLHSIRVARTNSLRATSIVKLQPGRSNKQRQQRCSDKLISQSVSQSTLSDLWRVPCRRA